MFSNVYTQLAFLISIYLSPCQRCIILYCDIKLNRAGTTNSQVYLVQHRFCRYGKSRLTQRLVARQTQVVSSNRLYHVTVLDEGLFQERLSTWQPTPPSCACKPMPNKAKPPQQSACGLLLLVTGASRGQISWRAAAQQQQRSPRSDTHRATLFEEATNQPLVVNDVMRCAVSKRLADYWQVPGRIRRFLLCAAMVHAQFIPAFYPSRPCPATGLHCHPSKSC